MKYLTRAAWFLGNWLAQIAFAFRHGYRNGQVLRPGSRPAGLERYDAHVKMEREAHYHD